MDFPARAVLVRGIVVEISRFWYKTCLAGTRKRWFLRFIWARPKEWEGAAPVPGWGSLPTPLLPRAIL